MSQTLTDVHVPTDAQQQAAAKFRALEASLNRAFFERRQEIRCILVALAASEHVLLLGDPGTGKSALAQAVAKALSGSEYFQNLMARTSKPEEVFGPYDLPGLKAGRYERKVQGYLPTADVAFLDEIFKCNSAVLNGLLTIINERTYKQGTQQVRCPLKVVIGASNELPDQNATDSLDALYDRFMLRRWVEDVKSRDNMRALLASGGQPAVAVRISADELASMRALADAVHLPEDVLDAVLDLRDALARECAITYAPRRWVKAMKLVKASAAIAGRTVATTSDLEILADAMWRTPEERAQVAGQVIQVVSTEKAEALKVLDAATEAMDDVDLEATGPAAVAAHAQLNGQLCDMAKAVRAMSEREDVQEIASQIDSMAREVQRAAMRHFGG